MESFPLLGTVLTNPFARGAVSGLGLVNLLAAAAELWDLFGGRQTHDAVVSDDPERLGDHHVS